MQKGVCVCIKALVLRENGTLLAIHRTKTAPSNPTKWDIPGGILEFGEDPSIGIIRETKEETSLEIQNLKIIGTYSEMHRDGAHGITIFYSARVEKPDVTLSYEHDEFKWVTPQEFLALDATKKSKRAVELLLKSLRATA